MKVTIHQPEHMPWLGFFHKMSQSELFVVLDNVQYEKNNWQNRNKFIDRKGETFWLTVPVQMKGHITSTIKDMLIENTRPWRRKYWGRFQDAYSKHPYFPVYADRIKEIIHDDELGILELNLKLIGLAREAFNINVPMVRASELGTTGKRSELLFDICSKLEASTYISGPAGRTYLDLDLFERNGINVEFHSFSHPTYDAPIFTPYLSAWDLILNHGPASGSYIGIPGYKIDDGHTGVCHG